MRKVVLSLMLLCLASTVHAQQPQTVTVTLTSAQLQSLTETPVVLVPAPGSGNYISASSGTLQYNAGAERYAGGHGRFMITLGPASSLSPVYVFEDTPGNGFIDQDNDQMQTLQLIEPGPSPELENRDLEIADIGSPFFDGDGTVTVSVTYYVLPVQ